MIIFYSWYWVGLLSMSKHLPPFTTSVMKLHSHSWFVPSLWDQNPARTHEPSCRVCLYGSLPRQFKLARSAWVACCISARDCSINLHGARGAISRKPPGSGIIHYTDTWCGLAAQISVVMTLDNIVRSVGGYFKYDWIVAVTEARWYKDLRIGLYVSGS